MLFIAVRCPYCQSDQIVKRGKTRRGTQRYLCHNTVCIPQSFLLEYRYQGRLPEVKEQIMDMSLNASGARDTAWVLHISPDTVLRALRQKEAVLESVNTALLRTMDPDEILVDIQQAGEAELDEMWSFVGKKGNLRWLWHAIGAPCKRYGGMSQDLGVYRYPLSRWGSAS
jgi:transposase-like protein